LTIVTVVWYFTIGTSVFLVTNLLKSFVLSITKRKAEIKFASETKTHDIYYAARMLMPDF